MPDLKSPRQARGSATREPAEGSRAERKRDRTRAELIAAAQEILAEQGAAASVQAIADRADVALGTLYYHFTDKNELLAVAAQQALADFESYMSDLTRHLEDSALTFATRVRLMLRAPRSSPAFARLFVRTFPDLLTSPAGFSDLALQDVLAAVESGAFTVKDPRLALLATSGAVHAMMAVTLKNPETADQLGDELVEMCLGMFGVTKPRAKEMAHSPLDLAGDPGVSAPH